MIARSFRRRLPLPALALLLPLAAACDGPTGTGSLSIDVTGALERSQTVTFTVLRDGQPVDLTRVDFTFDPADAVQPAGGAGTFRLLRAGAVTVTAAMPGLRGRRTVDVATPPMVVFDRLLSGNRDIWKVALDGLDLTRLTTDPGDDQDATVAQNTVVFVSFRGGNAELFSVPLAGGDAQRLTNTPFHELAPALRPDGQRLAFTYDEAGVAKLYTANPDASSRTWATPNFGFDGSIETGPAWAPAGGRLVFVTTSTGEADLYRMDPPGEPALFVGSANAAEVEPAFSPDGERVAFTSDNTPDGDTEVFVVRIATGAVTRLTTRPGPDAHPTWTRDGRLVYAELTGSTSRLRWLNPDVPGVSFPIETGTGNAARPFAVP
ncbi:MAG TPA: hypothetical protein VFX98_18070 [Longimicrobiaceae bacterium]|nr:hypothetical protein [Longimicrobiaceae bacterium]